MFDREAYIKEWETKNIFQIKNEIHDKSRYPYMGEGVWGEKITILKELQTKLRNILAEMNKTKCWW